MVPDSFKPAPAGRIFQINASNGGVPKTAIRQAAIDQFGLAGDRQANLDVHGGPERALCLYSLEHIQALQAEGHPIFAGSAGENLTLTGLDWSGIGPGTRLRLGDQALVEVTRFTSPCKTIAESFADRNFNRISQQKYPGWSRVYVRVLQPGIIRAGDPVWVNAAIDPAV
jgi:MOSC domain-containing protein YiiM